MLLSVTIACGTALARQRRHRVHARRIALQIGHGYDAGDTLEMGARIVAGRPFGAAGITFALVDAIFARQLQHKK